MKAAEPLNSPLHAYFEWDNTIAGTRYRLQQARELIRTVKFKLEIEETIVRLPVYIRDSSSSKNVGGYTKLSEIKTVNSKKAALIQEIDAAISHLRRAGNISVFLDDSKMIHSTLEKKADEVEGILDFIRGTKLIEKAA